MFRGAVFFQTRCTNDAHGIQKSNSCKKTRGGKGKRGGKLGINSYKIFH